MESLHVGFKEVLTTIGIPMDATSKEIEVQVDIFEGKIVCPL
jgi:hypothetical protein